MFDAATADQLDGVFEHRQRLQAEEVELHQPRLLDPLHVELRDRQRRARIAVERHQLIERTVADHDARGVRRGVAIKPLELHRDGEQPVDDRLLLARLFEARLAFDRLRQRHRIGGIGRHQLGEPVDLPVGHLEHAADVAQRGARLQRSEGDDLRDAIRAVALGDVVDDLVAAAPGKSRCRSPASTRGRD